MLSGIITLFLQDGWSSLSEKGHLTCNVVMALIGADAEVDLTNKVV